VKTWKIALITLLITLALGGSYLFIVWRHRQNPGVTPANDVRQTLSKDDLVVMREFFFTTFEATQRLEGTTVWMKNGYTMPYFPYTNGHVVFAKRAGVVPAAQRMDVKKIVKAVVPASLDDNMEHGSRQAFAVFALPGGTALYAVPIGYMAGSQEAVLLRPDFLLRRSAHDLRPLAQGCLGSRRRASGQVGNERGGNAHGHRAEPQNRRQQGRRPYRDLRPERQALDRDLREEPGHGDQERIAVARGRTGQPLGLRQLEVVPPLGALGLDFETGDPRTRGNFFTLSEI